MSAALSRIDQTRIAVAARGEQTYTITDIQQALDGYANASQCLLEMRRNGEIEEVHRSLTGKGRAIVWRTIKLRPVKQPAAPAAKPKTTHQADGRRGAQTRWAARAAQADAESTRQECALRLQAALDQITRRNREVRHA